MAPPRRAAAPPPPPVTGGSVNFGEDTFYSGGLGLPEGDYAMTFHTQMFQPTKQNGTPTGQAFLAVMATAYPIDAAGNLLGEPSEHPLGCGRKSHESFVPSEDGKGFDAVPGGTGVGMNDQTNWAIFRKSLVDCGLPAGTLTNDLGVLDGIWVHTRNVPEPEDRKSLRKAGATGEAALAAQQGQAEDTRTKLIPVVTEILAKGKPWEGTGGIPEETKGPPAKTARVMPIRPGTVRRGAPPPPPAQPDGEVTEEDLMAAALEGVTAHLSKPANVNGCNKVQLRTGVFAEIQKKQGDDMANAVLETFFNSDEAVNSVINQLGYQTSGIRIIVAPQ